MWDDDAELQGLFRDEVSERARRLAEGGRDLPGGSLDPDRLTVLVRDAHTIKGSARVMGYGPLARGAELLETTWKRLAGRSLDASTELGERLAALADTLAESVAANPAEGTAELLNAIADLTAELEGDQPRPRAVTSAAARQAVPDPPASHPTTHPVDLGGLLSTLGPDVVEESAEVESNGLYRLISRAAEARVDTGHLRETVSALRLAASGSPREVASLAARWEEAVEALDETVRDLQDQAMALAAVPLSEVTDAFPRLVRFLSERTGKHVTLERIGDEVEVDRQILDQIAEPLRHLVVNAVEHGLETPAERQEAGKPPTGQVTITTRIENGNLTVTVEDDGRGVDWDTVSRLARRDGLLREGGAPSEELTRVLFRPGFTTSRQHTELGGDGSGLAILAEVIERLNGSTSLDSQPGGGTRVELTVPAWWAVQDLVLVRAGGHTFGLPKTAVGEVSRAGSEPTLPSKDRQIPVHSLADAVGLSDEGEADEVVILSARAGTVALSVEEVVGRRQLVVKALGPLLGELPHLAGAAVVGGTEVVVVIEPNQLVRRVDQVVHLPGPRLLVVDDSAGVRQLLSATLAGHGFQTVVAASADRALELVQAETFDGMVVDYSMPGSDGLELVEAVRRNHANLPIVMVSGVADADVQERARAAGLDAYFDKADLRQGALADTLHELVSRRRQVRLRAVGGDS